LIESAVRRMRPWLMPEYRRAFAALVARGLKERREGERVVCCDFENPAIDAVGGRYYFSLVRDLIDAGFFPVFTARRATLSTFGTSRMKSLLLKERLGVIKSLDELREPYDLITDREAPPPANARRVVKVSYKQRLCRSDDELAFPVFVHPQITTKTKLPVSYEVEAERPARIFFGGNTEQGKYDKDVIREVYGMLSRHEMLTETIAAMSPEMIHRPKDAAEWLASPHFHPFVLCETQHCKIPQERWLEALAKADFFLACPGVGMPLCHNVTEALAAGCIPILQYADYLPPPLENGVNCLAISDAAGLRNAISSSLGMRPEEIRTMRRNVRKYYDAFLAPGRFTKRLLSGPRTLLLNAYRVPR
jgi:glycosyltransferase involved in cell wall biosynthesis